jgi:hypothetical protein
VCAIGLTITHTLGRNQLSGNRRSQSVCGVWLTANSRIHDGMHAVGTGTYESALRVCLSHLDRCCTAVRHNCMIVLSHVPVVLHSFVLLCVCFNYRNAYQIQMTQHSVIVFAFWQTYFAFRVHSQPHCPLSYPNSKQYTPCAQPASLPASVLLKRTIGPEYFLLECVFMSPLVAVLQRLVTAVFWLRFDKGAHRSVAQPC